MKFFFGGLKKHIILLLFLTAYIQALSGSAWKIEQYNYFGEEIKPTLTLYAKNYLDSQYTITAFFLVNNKWGEGYIGLNYKFSDWLAAELELGIETWESVLRVSPAVFMNKDEYSFYGVLEFGGSVNWYYLKGDYNYGDLYYALMLARFYGLGPRVEYNFPGTLYRLWGSVVYDLEFDKFGAMLGFSVIFD